MGVEIEKEMEIQEEIHYKNWFTQLWRLRSPTIGCLQAEDPGKPVE